jgi:hypothetical protein
MKVHALVELPASLFLILLLAPALGSAQKGSAQNATAVTATPLAASAPTAVPGLIPYAGIAEDRDGKPLSGSASITFQIFRDEQGGEPLWVETQKAAFDASGRYTVQLGASSPTGLPATAFASGEGRWLEVQIGGQEPQPRVLITSVPYAMKAADAEALAGHAAADFVTQEQLATVSAQNAAANSAISLLTSGSVTGSGTTGTVPLWTGSLTQGNSEITQVGSDIGVNEATPTATLDVGGPANVRGALTLPPVATATASGGKQSQLLELSSSAWSTSSNAAVAQNFQFLAEPTGNDTATPGGALYLAYQNGTATPTNLLSIASTGQMSFAPGQQFPGTITGALGTSPILAGVTGHNITVSISTAALETTLDNVFAQTGVANTFHGNQTVLGSLDVTALLTGEDSVLSGSQTAQLFEATGAIIAKSNATATSAAGVNSPFVELGASSWSSSSSAAVPLTYAWEAQPTGNNTATPGANLALLYETGTPGLSPTGLSITPKGVINFSPSQTFPISGGSGGTITGITTTSPLTGSGTAGSVALGLNESALVTGILPTLITFFPQLATANTFTGNQTVMGTITSTVSASEALGPILALTNPAGGPGAEAAVDFRTYLHAASAAVPSARIVAYDDNNYGNDLYFLSKTDGADANGLQTNVEIPSTGGLIATGHTSSSGVGATGIAALGAESTGSTGGADGGQFYAGAAAGSGNGGTGVLAVGGGSATGSGGPGGYFYGGDTSGSLSESTIPFGGTGGTFQGGSAPSSIPGDGIYATAGPTASISDATGSAGVFEGDVYVSGTLNAGSKNFKIDHPLDPANKYLMHASVESSENMNIYTGNVVTDQYGNAVVKLPDWFQALNTDFRYQLTVIGKFAQAIVSKEIDNNQFTISTNATFVKVSWQVTGVRQDPYAKAHPLVVEMQKPASERGFYIHPELYGQPEEKQTEWGRHPEMMKKLKARRREGSVVAP